MRTTTSPLKTKISPTMQRRNSSTDLSDSLLRVECGILAAKLLDMELVRAIRAEYVDEQEVVSAKLREVVQFCKETRFVLTPEMAVGVFFTVTCDCACTKRVDPDEFDQMLLLFARLTGYSKP